MRPPRVAPQEARKYITRPEYTGPFPAVEDLDTACTEVMESPFSATICTLADESPSMRALLFSMEELCNKQGLSENMKAMQGYNLLRGVMIGMLAERKRRTRGVQ